MVFGWLGARQQQKIKQSKIWPKIQKYTGGRWTYGGGHFIMLKKKENQSVKVLGERHFFHNASVEV